jgi:hypothetical protein
MKKNNDEINVYWAPYISYGSSSKTNDWSMLYPDPTNLYSDLLKLKAFNEDSKFSFFACPATKNNFKNTYVFKNALHSEYSYDVNQFPVITPKSKNFLDCKIVRSPSVSVGPLIQIFLSYVFFSDEELEVFFSQPTFHKSKYTVFGSPMPGGFNIGSWFRPYNFELQMWNQSGELILEDNEPLFYAKFLTNKNIKMHRFHLSEKLFNYGEHCSNSPFTIKGNVPLINRYVKFKESRMKDMVLQEIKQNLILKQEGH